MGKKIHFEVLPEVQRRVLGQLGPVVDKDGFYLAGGTAIALQLGHRRSIDFDWFTDQSFDDPHHYAGRLRRREPAWKLEKAAPGTLHGTVDGVKVSFLYYQYPQIEERVAISDHSCAMASLHDLGSMKLAAVAQRGSRKDFVDVWALVQHGFGLREMLAAYQKKYTTDDIAHLLMSLTYFDDAELEPMPMMLIDIAWTDIKEAIRGWVKDFASSS